MLCVWFHERFAEVRQRRLDRNASRDVCWKVIVCGYIFLQRVQGARCNSSSDMQPVAPPGWDIYLSPNLFSRTGPDAIRFFNFRTITQNERRHITAKRTTEVRLVEPYSTNTAAEGGTNNRRATPEQRRAAESSIVPIYRPLPFAVPLWQYS